MNLGAIEAWDGTVSLLGYTVDNQGTIDATRTQIGAGISILLHPKEGIYIHPSQKHEEKVGISHSGTIRSLETELKADGNLYAFAIKDDGVIDASRFTEKNGRILLTADQGTIDISGQVHAPGGEVEVFGKHLLLSDRGTLDVSAQEQAGTIYFGGNPTPYAQSVYVSPNAQLLTRGIEEGHGGKIIAWGKEANLFYGTFNADGGTKRGNGGFVEISSHDRLVCLGTGSATATNGAFGEVLFDPSNINITGGVNVNCIPGAIYTITPNVTATVAVTVPALPNLQSLLNGGTNVTISTNTGGGLPVGTMTVSNNVTWATPANLTLISNSNMQINADVRATTSGNLSLTSLGGSVSVGGQTGAPRVGTVSGTLTISAFDSVNILGATGGQASVENDNGPINITATNGSVNVGFANGNQGFLGSLSFFFGSCSLNINAGQDFTINQSFSIVPAGTVNVNVGRDIALTNNGLIFTTPSPGNNMTMTAGRDFILDNVGNITQNGSFVDMQLIAGRNMQILNNSVINKGGSSDMNLVVDNAFPTFPNQGPGFFELDATSSIIHSGTETGPGGVHTGASPLRIFTSVRSQNTIQGTIRGVNFVPGPAFVNTDLEQWCEYFFNPFFGAPFTVFYKECEPIIVLLFEQSSAPIVTVEILRNLHPYDEYLGWPLYFDFLYRNIGRSPVPYFMRVEKRFDHNPKEKEVETFDAIYRPL